MYPELLTASKYWYIDPSGDDTNTGTSSADPWETLAKALEEADKLYFPRYYVTVEAAPGVYSYHANYYARFEHPCGGNFILKGAEPLYPGLTSIGTCTQVTDGWNVNLTLANTTDISVGHYLCIVGTGDNTATAVSLLLGCHKILSKSGNTVTVFIRSQSATSPSGLTTPIPAGSTDVFVLRSIFEVDSSSTNEHGFCIEGGAAGLMKDFVIRKGYETGSGIFVWRNGHVHLQNIFTDGFALGWNVSQGGCVTSGSYCGASGAKKDGIDVSNGGFAYLGSFVANGNKGAGIVVSPGSTGFFQGSAAIANGWDGFHAGYGSTVDANLSLANYNTLHGFEAVCNGTIRAQATEAKNNGGNPFQAWGMSYIWAKNTDVTGTPSPDFGAPNLNEQSFISDGA